jgi:hypothetical protein
MGALGARGDTTYSYAFMGTVSNESFVGPPPALASIATGDTFLFTFDVDANTDEVENINADFVSAGIDLFYPGDDTGFTWYTGGSPYEYRWDFNLPGMSPYTMIFWFRTTTPGVVMNGVPPTIDATQFNYLTDFDIYYNTGDGGPPTINVSLQNAVPEPATFGLAAFGVLLVLCFARFRKRSAGQPHG